MAAGPGPPPAEEEEAAAAAAAEAAAASRSAGHELGHCGRCPRARKRPLESGCSRRLVTHSRQLAETQHTSALSPNAKEFIFPNMQGQGSSTNGMFPGDSPLNLSPLQYSNAFDVFAAYGGLNEKSFVDGLNFSLNNMQYSNQQFQPVMAN